MIGLKIMSAGGVGFLCFVLVMIGLHRMNAQHVRRQMRYTEIIMENKEKQPQNPLVVIPKPQGVKAP